MDNEENTKPQQGPLSIVKDLGNTKSCREPWYKEGLRFSCTECGKCCTGTPGYVWLQEEDIEKIIQHLNISVEEFAEKYIRLVNGRISLKECGPQYDCIFLQGKKCSIYSARPRQCRTFPWWPHLLESKENWEETALYCEGIRNDATLVSYEEIEKERIKP